MQVRRAWRLGLLVGLLAGPGWGGAVLGFQAPQTGSDLVALLPALRTAPPPQWVGPGVRITYHTTVKSGQGFTQVNVVALSRQMAVLSVRSYGLASLTGPPVLLATWGAVGPAGAAGDFWANPAILRRAVGMEGQGTTVVRMPYQIQQRTYQAIRIQYESQRARHVYVYDEPSGVLLRGLSSLKRGGELQPVYHSEYRGTRTVQIPWARDAVPNWLATVRRLQYSGSHAVTLPGSPVIPLSLSATAQIANRGINWLQYHLTMQIGGVQGAPPQVSQVEAVSGYAQIGGLFVSPAGLAKLRQGQTIDRDPFTQVTATVAGAGQGLVTLSEVGPGQRTDFSYNARTGMLTALRLTNEHLHMRRELRLTGTQ